MGLCGHQCLPHIPPVALQVGVESQGPTVLSVWQERGPGEEVLCPGGHPSYL